jgi:hypothetical protein
LFLYPLSAPEFFRKLSVILNQNDDAAQLHQQFLSGKKENYFSLIEMLADFTYVNPSFTYYRLEMTYLY